MTAPPDATRPGAAVAIVDDDQILCELLEGRIDDEFGLVCVGTAVTAEEARSLVLRTRPQVILLDIRMGSGVDAIGLAAELVGLSPTSHILIWTTWSDPSPDREEELRLKIRATRAGATDWIAKGDGLDNLIDKIREAVARGPAARADPAVLSPLERLVGSILGGAIVASGAEHAADTELTPAERRAVAPAARGLESGMNIEEVANAMRMKTETLRTHLRHIYVKWGVRNQAQFVAAARRRGLI